MSESQVDIASTEQPSVSGKAYFALAMLVIVYTLNFIDRQIISILLPSIQAELSIADWQAGLLAGAFFALFYSTL
ncbi:MAG: MFS transporter, partial [Pseudomonadota bacterium]